MPLGSMYNRSQGHGAAVGRYDSIAAKCGGCVVLGAFKGHIMEGDTNSLESRASYIADTLQRTDSMIRCLLSMYDDCQSQMGQLTRQLHEQTEASRSNGFGSIARLCRSMEACLAKIEGAEKLQSDPAVSALIESCRLISEHAEILSTIPGGRAQPRRSNQPTILSSVEHQKTTLCASSANSKGDS